ncbi:LINE-1 retrotransposable element ORF2 protein [Varanus komodoensis]|nr:LINE-1 retrotransposable element ORF2 protein [Varanus komodoensis]
MGWPGLRGIQGPPGKAGPPGPKGDRGPSGDKASTDSVHAELEQLKTQMKLLEARIQASQGATTSKKVPPGVRVGEKTFSPYYRHGYDGAKFLCEQNGGTVASPRNAAENRALQQLVKAQKKSAILGINDREVEGSFREILDILEYYEIHTEKPMALLFLDAQKAFDNVNWQFMEQQMIQMEFGERFMNAISSIYQKQSARILINGELSNPIEIQKGTRQGCPLSPLLFLMILEVLNRCVRDDEDIKGTRIRDESYKLQEFADDLVFKTEEPFSAMPKLVQWIEEYGEVTGMKINREKTKLLVKNLTREQKERLQEQVDLQIVKKVKYLGIYLTAKCTTLKEDNYDKLLKDIKGFLEKWANLQISLMGRTALVKMNILPKLLFLFQMIPVKIDKKFFDDLNFHISRFIWRKKKPRIKLKMLQEDKRNGGFGLPDQMLYYQASVLTWLKEWVTLRNKRILYLEGHDLQMGWHAYMWYEKAKSHGSFLSHFIRRSLMSVWEKLKLKVYNKLPRWLSPMEALVYPNVLNFEKIIRYGNILDKYGGLKLEQEIQEQGLNISWWYKVQMQSRYVKDCKTWGFYRDLTEFDQVMLKTDEKIIKRLYDFLLDREMEGEQVKETMITWAQNFGFNVEL